MYKIRAYSVKGKFSFSYNFFLAESARHRTAQKFHKDEMSQQREMIPLKSAVHA